MIQETKIKIQIFQLYIAFIVVSPFYAQCTTFTVCECDLIKENNKEIKRLASGIFFFGYLLYKISAVFEHVNY
jgi:hypothetical protein